MGLGELPLLCNELGVRGLEALPEIGQLAHEVSAVAVLGDVRQANPIQFTYV